MSFKNKILHIAVWDKFIPPYIEFVQENFNKDEHIFFVIRGVDYIGDFKEGDNVFEVRSLFQMLSCFISCQKVILHGMFSRKLILFLLLLYPLLAKVYWAMWGGDVYFDLSSSKGIKEKITRSLRLLVLKKLKNFITGIPGDYEYLRNRYGVSGKVFHCLGYLSNVIEEPFQASEVISQKRILVGNSATISNNHFKCFEMIKEIDPGDLEVISPLSYGDKEYGRDVAKVGKELFGDRFIPLVDFIPYGDYLKLLANIQFAILNQKRQQSVGSIIQLLGIGTKIYMDDSSSHFRYFKDEGFFVFSFRDMNFEPLSLEQVENNRDLAIKKFSKSELFKQWEIIFKA